MIILHVELQIQAYPARPVPPMHARRFTFIAIIESEVTPHKTMGAFYLLEQWVNSVQGTQIPERQPRCTNTLLLLQCPYRGKRAPCANYSSVLWSLGEGLLQTEPC